MVTLSPAEWAAVDTPVFQRLRRVRQLAMTHLVYPGAVHTRFENSIGVRHIAGRLSESLGLDDEDRDIVQIAALLHDVGHGVFSHVSEQVIDELSGAEGVHEAVSVAIMRTDQSLQRALGGERCERAAEIVALEGPRTAMRDIVTGPTDADKLDYLLRDSYYAGVNYGRYRSTGRAWTPSRSARRTMSSRAISDYSSARGGVRITTSGAGTRSPGRGRRPRWCGIYGDDPSEAGCHWDTQPPRTGHARNWNSGNYI
jgi:hypothetical protein